MFVARQKLARCFKHRSCSGVSFPNHFEPGEPQSANACGFLITPLLMWAVAAIVARNGFPLGLDAGSALALLARRHSIVSDELAGFAISRPFTSLPISVERNEVQGVTSANNL